MPQNNGHNHLHGGPHAFDLRRWDYEVRQEDDAPHIDFSLVDEAGSNGYPGTLTSQVTHSYYKDNRWLVTYQARSDQDTLFNPTNHVYFNLNGAVSAPITNHQLQIHADEYVRVNADGAPKEKASVEGQPLICDKVVSLQTSSN